MQMETVSAYNKSRLNRNYCIYSGKIWVQNGMQYICSFLERERILFPQKTNKKTKPTTF